MSDYLVSQGRTGLDPRLAIIPVGGIGNMPAFARAAEIAARAHACPVPEGAPNYPVVVRPVDSASGTEM
ncbi:hypothetical protein [Streptomyces erythrochromogenes]|uniref:hypothetical protein n=1 Tax=Streptomyces erythrochromogenes TaxID=285574 RepID=UPI003683636E